MLDTTDTTDTLPIPSTSIARDAKEALSLMEASLSASTRRAYATAVKQFAEYCKSIGTSPVLSEECVLLWLGHLSAEGKSYATINTRLAGLSKLAELEGISDLDDSRKIRRVMRGLKRSRPAQQKKARSLTAQDIRSMVEGSSNPRDIALVLFGWESGLRRSELMALDWDDIAVSDRGIIVTVKRSKTDQTGRGRVFAVHRSSNEFCPVRALLSIKEPGARGAVFRNQHGMRLDGRSVALILKGMADKAELSSVDVSGHSLRSGMITHVLDSGGSIEDVHARTGQSPSTILGYWHGGDEFARSKSVCSAISSPSMDCI